MWANLTKEKKTAGFELDESLQAAKGRLFRLGGAQEEFPLSAKSTIDLGPNEVAILAIDPKR